MGPVLGTQDALTEIQRAVRNQFQEGGSVAAALIVVLGVVTVVVVVYLLTRLLRKRGERDRCGDPKRLFDDLLRKLDLSTPQRHVLTTVAGDLHLTHPSVILLSPALFDHNMARWQARRGLKAPDDRLVGQLRATLFP